MQHLAVACVLGVCMLLVLRHFFYLRHVSVVVFVLYFVCVFELASFLNLQLVSANENVLTHCYAFALVGHRNRELK